MVQTDICVGWEYICLVLVDKSYIFQETSFEDYLMWMLLTAGFYWFIQEHPEIFFKIQDKMIQTI